MCWWRYVKPVSTTAAVLVALLLLALIALRDRGSGNSPAVGGTSDPHAKVVAGGVPPSVPPAPSSKPTTEAAPAAAPQSPLAGRWQAEMADDGKKLNCLMDLAQDQGMGQLPVSSLSVAFSDGCPFPFCGASGIAYFASDGTWAPTLYRAGKDTGTFSFQAGGLNGFSGAYRLEGETTLVLSYAQRGKIQWQRVRAEGPLPNGADAVLPAQVEWPVKDVPGLVQRARDYVRSHWQKDAVLLSLELECQPVLGEVADVKISFAFHSPATRKGLRFEPGSKVGSRVMEYGAGDGGGHPIPARFLDLPEAIASLRPRGLTPKQVSGASLKYDQYYDYRNVRGNNAILPPCPYKESGFHWQIKSEPRSFYVLAEKP
jgi:hypothetical protein